MKSLMDLDSIRFRKLCLSGEAKQTVEKTSLKGIWRLTKFSGTLESAYYNKSKHLFYVKE